MSRRVQTLAVHGCALCAPLLLLGCELKKPQGQTGASGVVSPVRGVTYGRQLVYPQLNPSQQARVNCLGALSAHGDFDKAAASTEAVTYLAAYRRTLGRVERSVDGPGGRSEVEQATRERDEFWRSQPAFARSARARACLSAAEPEEG